MNRHDSVIANHVLSPGDPLDKEKRQGRTGFHFGSHIDKRGRQISDQKLFSLDGNTIN